METKLPKFEVGEVVILVNDMYPSINGEYTVHEVGSLIENGVGILSGERYLFDVGANGNYIYSLGVDLIGTGDITAVSESILRKKHQPGTMPFTELMSSLKVPKMEKV